MGEKDPYPHNLPHPLTRFIGREVEIVEVRKLLSGNRLLTLTGIGGSGKTRLAIEIASQLSQEEEYPEGAWLVELAELSDPAFVPQAIAATLGLYKEPGRPLFDALVAALRSRRLLLVLDNCEHLIEACASISQALLLSCPQLRILATSREPLQVPGEISWQVLPLSLPDDPISAQDLGSSEAIQLFIDRARSILPTFAITEQNVSEIVQLCRRLDGIPLALELAAAWVDVLSVAQIHERLDHSLQLLVRGSRTVPARQQTLRAALDWSYALLSDPEKVLFQRLALFLGDFGLSSAEAICSGEGLEEAEILDLLSHLVSKSLVLAVHADDGKRFRLLEIVRQYSLEKLVASQEEAYVSDRFLDYYLSIAKKAEPEFSRPQQVKWITALEQELSHLRTALHLSQEDPARILKGLQLASALSQYWQLRGYLSEGTRWLEELLQSGADAPAPIKAEALLSAGFLASFLEDYDRSNAWLEEARDIYQRLGEDEDYAWAVVHLGGNAQSLEDYGLAIDLAGQSLDIFKKIGDRMGVAVSLFTMVDATYFQKDIVKAEALLRESLEMCRQIENRWAAARRLARLGQFALIQGRPRQAADALEEGLGMAQAVGDKWGLVLNLAGLAELAADQGQPERSARLLAGAQAIFEVFSTRLRQFDRTLYENCEAAVQAQLGEQVYQAIWSEMRTKSLEQIVDYALNGPGRIDPATLVDQRGPPSQPLTPLQESKAKYGGLTAREREVATLVAQGKSNASIAEELFVGVRTVEAHITRILTKLNFTSRTQIAGWAISKGLAQPPGFS